MTEKRSLYDKNLIPSKTAYPFCDTGDEKEKEQKKKRWGCRADFRGFGGRFTRLLFENRQFVSIGSNCACLRDTFAGDAQRMHFPSEFWGGRADFRRFGGNFNRLITV